MAETTAERAARIAQEMADKPTTDRQLEQERVAAEAAQPSIIVTTGTLEFSI